jgi:hypothetical protein
LLVTMRRASFETSSRTARALTHTSASATYASTRPSALPVAFTTSVMPS